MVDEHIVELTPGGLLLDGSPYTLAQGSGLDLGNSTRVVHRAESDGDTYYITWNGKAGPVLSWNRSLHTAGLYVPPDPDNDLQGLLGNADGNPNNDLRLPDGTQLPAAIPQTTLYGSYTSSWRITDGTSMFTYGPGQSTATFTDTSYPRGVVTIDQLTPEQIALATAVCASHGVPPGPQFNDCVVDVTITQDNDFAAMASEVTTVTIDPNAATATPDGNLSIDFEASALPANVRPARVTNDPATTAFAGPFSGSDGYRFFVQSLPPHVTGTLSFDLIALGDWTADADQEKVSVQINRVVAASQTFAGVTPARSGVLANGVPFAVYPMTVPVNDASSQLEAVVSATGVDGLANQGFGVDNLALHVNVVAPQIFDTSLPFTVSNGVPAAGAGNLETSVSQDVYGFTVPDGQSLYLDVVNCAGALVSWRLYDPAGKQAAVGYCGGRQVDGLAGGAYRMVVSSSNLLAGTYGVHAFVVPPPDTFADSLPLSVSNGVPGPGAGNLETKASRDEYRFTVPDGRSVYIDAPTCIGLNSVAWTLVNAVGSAVASSGCSTPQVDNLVGGEYRLVVDAPNGYVGGYTLNAFLTPATDSYAVSLPLSVSNGVPGPGAGNLETKASRDEYTFTVADGQSLYVDAQTCPGRSTTTLRTRRHGWEVIGRGAAATSARPVTAAGGGSSIAPPWLASFVGYPNRVVPNSTMPVWTRGSCLSPLPQWPRPAGPGWVWFGRWVGCA